MKKTKVMVGQIMRGWREIVGATTIAVMTAFVMGGNDVFAATTMTPRRSSVGMVQMGAILLLMILFVGLGHRFNHRNG